MTTFLWSVAAIGVFLFVAIYLFPLIKYRIIFWYYGRKLRRGAEQEKDLEVKADLKEIADAFTQLSKTYDTIRSTQRMSRCFAEIMYVGIIDVSTDPPPRRKGNRLSAQAGANPDKHSFFT